MGSRVQFVRKRASLYAPALVPTLGVGWRRFEAVDSIHSGSESGPVSPCGVACTKGCEDEGDGLCFPNTVAWVKCIYGVHDLGIGESTQFCSHRDLHHTAVEILRDPPSRISKLRHRGNASCRFTHENGFGNPGLDSDARIRMAPQTQCASDHCDDDCCNCATARVADLVLGDLCIDSSKYVCSEKKP